jgi:hypothetical protein
MYDEEEEPAIDVLNVFAQGCFGMASGGLTGEETLDWEGKARWRLGGRLGGETKKP